MHDRACSLATFAVLMFVVLANTTSSPIARVQGAQHDPVLGTWTMNPEKSKFNPGPAPQNVVRTYVAAGDAVKVTVEGLDALTANEVLKKGGKQIYTATRTVSKDGKLLTLMSSGTNTSGKQTNNITVYDRQ